MNYMPFKFTEEQKEKMLLDGLSRVYVAEYLKHHTEIAGEAERFVRQVLDKTSVKELFAVLDVWGLLGKDLEKANPVATLEKINMRYGVDFRQHLHRISGGYHCINIDCPQGYYFYDVEEAMPCPQCRETMIKE